MPEERLTISSTGRMHPDEVVRHTFGAVRRGFDPSEVRAFLDHVAREMVASAEREQELRRAVAEAEDRAAHPVLDDATLTAALGQETARVLQSAHDAATELMARAEQDARELVARATREAEDVQRRTEEVMAERRAQSEAAMTELRRRAQDEATQKLEVARLEADALMTQTRSEGRAMVQEAQELRARVLADLTRRRRVLHSQIEQLRAGRERLAETIGDVRSAVDQITDELFRAEDEARLAAEAAGRQAANEELADLPVEDPGVADASRIEAERSTSVDELFARLRAQTHAIGHGLDAAPTPGGPIDAARASGEASGDADHASSPPPVARSQPAATPTLTAVPPPPEASAAPAPQPTAPVAEPAGSEGRVVAGAPAPRGSLPQSSPGGGAATPTAAVGAADDTTAPSPEAQAAGEDEEDELVRRRDEVLVPVVTTLARRLKRALQDDQNDILDRLRAKGGWGPNVLLPENEHARRYVGAAAAQLLDASRAGADFVGGTADKTVGVDEVAAALANDIVAPLRRRLDGEGQAVDVGDDTALVELVGAAFREWKGPRVERLASDQAVLAFSQGALAAVPGGTTLRWVVDDDGAECPDCDDNALAGPVPAGEEFPTGHRHPPAHAGCRCLLTPVTA